MGRKGVKNVTREKEKQREIALAKAHSSARKGHEQVPSFLSGYAELPVCFAKAKPGSTNPTQ